MSAVCARSQRSEHPVESGAEPGAVLAERRSGAPSVEWSAGTCGCCPARRRASHGACSATCCWGESSASNRARSEHPCWSVATAAAAAGAPTCFARRVHGHGMWHWPGACAAAGRAGRGPGKLPSATWRVPLFYCVAAGAAAAWSNSAASCCSPVSLSTERLKAASASPTLRSDWVSRVSRDMAICKRRVYWCRLRLTFRSWRGMPRFSQRERGPVGPVALRPVL